MPRCQIQQAHAAFGDSLAHPLDVPQPPDHRRTMGRQVGVGIDQAIDKGVDGNHCFSRLGV
jgi:hypothetical protein